MKHLVLLSLLALAACKEDVATLPPPMTLSAEAVGHYCQMDLLEHPGPKAQVHLEGMAFPLFFSQVRDAAAYRAMPEQSHRIIAIYVNDMEVAPSWTDTGADNWIDATTAVYVTGASVAGGMGEADFIPFANTEAAAAFAAQHGGEVLPEPGLPDPALLLPTGGPGATVTADQDEFLQRLRAVSQPVGG